MTWFDNQPEGTRLAMQANLGHNLAAPVREYAEGDTGFGRWLLIAVSAYFMRVHPPEFVVPEASWRDLYDSRLTPLDGLEVVLPLQPVAADRR